MYFTQGMIEAIYLDEGELISAGVDGFIKVEMLLLLSSSSCIKFKLPQVWDFETIDSADISDENATFELEPMLEIKVGSSVCFKSLTRSVDPDTPTLWYGQDASGAIWAIDIVVSHTVSISPVHIWYYLVISVHIWYYLVHIWYYLVISVHIWVYLVIN